MRRPERAQLERAIAAALVVGVVLVVVGAALALVWPLDMPPGFYQGI